MVIGVQGTKSGLNDAVGLGALVGALSSIRLHKKTLVLQLTDNEETSALTYLDGKNLSIADETNLGKARMNDSGIDSLLRRAASIKLTQDNFESASEGLLNGEFFAVADTTARSEFRETLKPQAIENMLTYAEEVYDNVIVIVDTTYHDDKAFEILSKIINMCDIVLTCIPQLPKIHKSIDVNKPELLVATDFDPLSKFNIPFLKKLYEVKDVYTLHKNAGYSDAKVTGELLHFIMSNKKTEADDVNMPFMKALYNLTDSLDVTTEKAAEAKEKQEEKKTRKLEKAIRKHEEEDDFDTVENFFYEEKEEKRGFFGKKKVKKSLVVNQEPPVAEETEEEPVEEFAEEVEEEATEAVDMTENYEERESEEPEAVETDEEVQERLNGYSSAEESVDTLDEVDNAEDEPVEKVSEGKKPKKFGLFRRTVVEDIPVEEPTETEEGAVEEPQPAEDNESENETADAVEVEQTEEEVSKEIETPRVKAKNAVETVTDSPFDEDDIAAFEKAEPNITAQHMVTRSRNEDVVSETNWTCPHCGGQSNSKYCPRCGTRGAWFCPICGSQNYGSFCGECGAKRVAI